MLSFLILFSCPGFCLEVRDGLFGSPVKVFDPDEVAHRSHLINRTHRRGCLMRDPISREKYFDHRKGLDREYSARIAGR